MEQSLLILPDSEINSDFKNINLNEWRWRYIILTLHFRACSLSNIKDELWLQKNAHKTIRRFCYFLLPRGLVCLYLCCLVVKPNAQEDETLVDSPQKWLRKFIPFRPHLYEAQPVSQIHALVSSTQCLTLFRLLLYYTTTILFANSQWTINYLTEFLSSSD